MPAGDLLRCVAKGLNDLLERFGIADSKLLAGLVLLQLVFEFLGLGVVRVDDVFQVVNFHALLGHLVLEFFALGGIGLFRFNAVVQFLAQAIYRTAEGVHRLFGFFLCRILVGTGLFGASALAIHKLLGKSDSSGSTGNRTN